MMIQLNNGKKIVGGRVLWGDVSFTLLEGRRAAIVGPNGSGKSTLMHCLAKGEPLDEGTIAVQRGAVVGHLAQLPTIHGDETVEAVLRQAFGELAELQAEMNRLEVKMAEENCPERIFTRYGDIQEQYMAKGGYECDSRLMNAANGLAITSLLHAPYATLSGGEKTKVELARLLLLNADVLLLDEPTNHLDVYSIQWLEKWLKESKATVLFVSHDRAFLAHVATEVLDINDGEVKHYNMKYEAYVTKKEADLLAQFAQYTEQQKKLKKMREAIKQLRIWANAANPPSESLHRRATNMERALERMEKIKKPKLEADVFKGQFKAGDRSGKDVFFIENVSQQFGERTVLRNVSAHVRIGERIAIVGRNGQGKTTLVRLLLEQLTATTGTIKIGSNVQVGYLAQNVALGKPEQTVLEAFVSTVPMERGQARSTLAKFLFYGNDCFKALHQLSGGERTRLRLAQLMQQPINVLILDEPTNHLDVESQQMLEATIEQFRGTVMCISHDRAFLRQFNRTWLIHDGQLEDWPGTVEEVLA